MATIDELTPEQISNPEIFQKIKDLGDSFVRRVQAKEAYFLREKLETLLGTSNLQNLNPDLYKNYQNLLVVLKWTALPLLPEEEVLEVLSHHFLAALENEDINAQERIEAKMFTFGLFPRNQLRQKMQKALQENNEKLGEQNIGDWIIGYSKMFNPEDRTELTPSEYTNKSPEAKALPEPKKNKLRKALQILDKTLLVTPVISEPLFSMAVRKMIKAGTIEVPVSPTLLKATSLPEITIPAKAAKKTMTEEKPKPTPTVPEKKPVPKKEEKAGLFEKLFGKKPEQPKRKAEPVIPTPVMRKKEEIEKGKEAYEKKISPYEKKRKTIPKESPMLKKKEEEVSSVDETEVPTDIEGAEDFEIRTMKKDVQEAKKGPKRPIPEKPKSMPTGRQAKIKDNIVDLSGK